MGRTLRTVRSGESELSVPIQSGTTGVNRIPNFGVTEITTDLSGMYVMGPPVKNVVKTFVATRVPATAVSVNFSTAETVTVGGSTAVSALAFSTAADAGGCIELIGVNSTEWAVKSLYNAGSTACIAVSTAIA